MKKGDIVYICGINISKGGKINLNRPPIKGVVINDNNSILLENNKIFSNYPGCEIHYDLEKCQFNYEQMKRLAIKKCLNQIDKFNKIINLLQES